MNIAEKLSELIGNSILYKGEIFKIVDHKIVNTVNVILITSTGRHINFHRDTLEFKNLKPIPTKEKMEAPIQTQNSTPSKNSIPNATDTQVVKALEGSQELKDSLLSSLKRIIEAKTPEEKKSARDDAKAISQIGKELNDLFKTGVRAVEIINKN